MLQHFNNSTAKHNEESLSTQAAPSRVSFIKKSFYSMLKTYKLLLLNHIFCIKMFLGSIQKSYDNFYDDFFRLPLFLPLLADFCRPFRAFYRPIIGLSVGRC